MATRIPRWLVHAPLLIDMLLVALAAAATVRLLAVPGFPRTDDGDFHLFRLADLVTVLGEGSWYPRWSPSMALGYGYPLYNFYPPLSSWSAAIFYLIGFSTVDAARAALVIPVVVAGWGMYGFTRADHGRAGALVAGIAYATLPYLLVDMYVRGAFAETWALALLPIVFSSARHLTERKTVGSLGAMGVALGALLMAHLAIALFAVPFAALYALIHGVHLHTDQTIAAPSGRSIGAEDEAHLQHADRDQRAAVGQITRLGAALILGLALSAIYWLPALGEIGLVSAQSLTGGFFDYRNHFHRTADLVQRSLLYDYRLAPGFRAGLVQVVISALGLVATLRVGQMRRSSVFFAVVLAISLGMQSERSSLLWERLPLLSYVLFPWRLLTLAGLASAYLAGALGSALFPVLAPKHFTLRRILANCLFGLLITILCATSLSSIDEPEMVAAQDVVTTAVMRQFERHRALIAASTSGVYLPRTSGVGPIAYTRLPQNPDPVPRPVHISVEAASPTALAVTTESEEPGMVIVDQMFFPGWQAWIDGARATATPFGALGLAATEVPAGRHRVEFIRGLTPLQTAATAVSAGAVAVLGLALVLRGWHRGVGRRAHHEDTKNTKGRSFPLSLPFPPAAGERGPARAGLVGWACITGKLAMGQRRERGAWGSLLLGTLVLVGIGAAVLPRRPGPVLGPVSSLGNGVQLAGWRPMPVRELAAVGITNLELFWTTTRALDHDFPIALRLLDREGRVVGQRDQIPDHGLRPPRLWLPGLLIRDEQQIRLAPGVAGGRYRLVAGIRDGQTWVGVGEGTPVAWREPDGGEGRGVALGEIDVGAAVPRRAPDLRHPAGVVFGEAIELASWELEGPPSRADNRLADVQPGDTLRVRLKWRSVADAEDYAVFVHLHDQAFRLLAQDDERPHRGYAPTVLWHEGDEVLDEYHVQIPPAPAPGRYTLSVGLYRRADMTNLTISSGPGSGDRYVLGTVKVRPIAPLLEQVSGFRPVGAVFGDWAQLRGVVVEPPGPPVAGSTLRVALYWQAVGGPWPEATVFVHLAGSAGPPLAQHDGPPLNGGFPLSIWEDGDVISDVHEIVVPAALPSGDYQILIGLYDPGTGARHQLADGGDAVRLTLPIAAR